MLVSREIGAWSSWSASQGQVQVVLVPDEPALVASHGELLSLRIGRADARALKQLPPAESSFGSHTAGIPQVSSRTTALLVTEKGSS